MSLITLTSVLLTQNKFYLHFTPTYLLRLFTQFYLFYQNRDINCTQFVIGFVKACVWSTLFCKCGWWTDFSTANSCRTVGEWWICRRRHRSNDTIQWSTYFHASPNVFSTNMVLPAQYRNTIHFACSRWISSTKRHTFSFGSGTSYCYSCWLDWSSIGEYSKWSSIFIEKG